MRLSGRLATLSYLLGPRPYALERPVVIQFPVIDICNSQCQMCRIWENKKSDDITPAALRQGLRNPLYSEVAAVGLNGGEPTLRKDLGELTEVLFDELPKLKNISLITNAYKFDEVISRIGDVGTVVSARGGHLDVMVSLDGYEDVHDRVRGKPGNFERSKKVLDFVRSSSLVGSVRIGCTVIKENVFGLADLFEYCQAAGLYVKYRLGIPHQRLYTQNLLDPYTLTAEEKYHLAEFLEGLIKHYEQSEHQKFFYRSLIGQLVLSAPRKAGCDWQHRGATITSKGELLYCAVESKALGNIATDDSEKIFFANVPHLREIIRDKCSGCNHDYVGLPPRRQMAQQIVLRAAKRVGMDGIVGSLASKGARSALIRRRRFLARLSALKQSGRASMRTATLIAQPDRGSSRVLLCGWYGTETLGDKAILGGVVAALQSTLGSVEFTLVSLHRYVSEMTRRQMPELRGIRIVEPAEGVALAESADLVVFAGGPLMAIDELAEMEAIFDRARVAGVTTVLAGCGVGPLGDAWQNDSLKRILQAASVRVFRDGRSRDLASSLRVDTTDDMVAEDPAFTWLHRQRAALASWVPPTDKKVLLLGLRDFPYGDYARHLDEKSCLEGKERFERELVRALEALVSQHEDLVVRPLPMCTNHFGDDDRWFYRRLFRGSEALQRRLDLSLLGRELAPLTYCEAFRTAHVALSMRFHALVFALALDVPAVAIDYTLGKGKVGALADRFGVPQCSLLDTDAGFLVREVNEMLVRPIVRASTFEPSFEAALALALPDRVRRVSNFGQPR